MSENTCYRFLQEVYLTERCFLYEVLLWRAFGRIPVAMHLEGEDDWRISEDIRDSYDAPIPDDYFFSAEECSFAGIGNDPRNEEENYLISDSRHYDQMIELLSESGNSDELENQKNERKKAERLEASLAEWGLEFDDCVDEFKSEIFLKLKKGELTAFGTTCSIGGGEHALDMWESEEKWPTQNDEKEIPKKNWISSAINWDQSALEGRENAFMWVRVSTDQLIEIFPPVLTVPFQDIKNSGSTFVIADNHIAHKKSGAPRVGRPSLPWDEFNVEVARMFRDGEVPKKQEAAIVELQDWFFRTHGLKPSRAAILPRLKTYYDRLVR
jgi:hypothetical protein